MPRLASRQTDRNIIPVAPQPDKPTSSFPILHKEYVTQITIPIPKKIKIDGGKINPKTAKINIITA